jgi:hypothetical protein
MGPGTAPKERNVGLTRRRRRRRQVVLERHPDDLPKRGLFTEPIRITRLEALEPETQEDGTTRVTFLVEVKDAEDKRCSDLAVDARVSGPERTATVQGATDMFGRVRVRMTGPTRALRDRGPRGGGEGSRLGRHRRTHHRGAGRAGLRRGPAGS